MGLLRRSPDPVYPPPFFLETKQRGLGCYWSLVLLGIVFCLVMTFSPSLMKQVSQVIPTLWERFVPSQASPTPTSSHSPQGSVIGSPSLSPQVLNQVFALAHSPAQGTGQALFDLSRKYSIDDAYALAFFKVESQYATTGVARVTRSLGNIRCSGYAHCLNGYRTYTSYQQGYEDWYRLIQDLYVKRWHLTTVQKIVPVYAPASDGNNPAAYISMVLQAVTVWQRGEVRP